MLKSPRKLVWMPVFTKFVLRVAMFACLLRFANSEEPAAQKPDLSKIRTWTLDERPLPRDRQEFRHRRAGFLLDRKAARQPN